MIVGIEAEKEFKMKMQTIGPADTFELVVKAANKSESSHLKSFKYNQGDNNGIYGLEFTLGDGKTIKAGKTCDKTFHLPESLYRIETIMANDEKDIYQMKFFGRSGVFTLGKDNSSHGPGRVETFNLDAGEELIGCKMHYETTHNLLRGVEWIKWRPN